MGEVYLGYDHKLERRVAVKTIRPDKRLSAGAKARFLREARLLSKLGHPAICQVYDLVETPRADFLILEYVEGQTLKGLAAGGSLPFSTRLALAEKIAQALAAAHRERIVHRDLKADNVMVTPAGEVKVLDFGIARSLGRDADDAEGEEEVGEKHLGGLAAADLAETLGLGPTPGPRHATEPVDDAATELTHQGVVVGTVSAMSPEQAAGGQVTEASDLYSLGVLLQELFTGRPAYDGTTAAEILPQVLRGTTRPRGGLDADLAALLGELLSLDPYGRPSALAVARRLADLAGKPQRLRQRRLRRALVAGSFVALLAVLAAVSWLAVAAVRARREAEHRRRQAESLVRFMISDLRPKLEGAGRLDLLDAVGNQTLAYFDGFGDAELTDGELTGRVEAIRQIGQVRRAQGNLPAAAAAFRRAIALGRRLVARAPDDAKRLRALLESRSWLGQVLQEQGRNAEALAAWRETLAAARAEAARRPGDLDWQNVLGTALHNVGTALEAQGDLAGALASYREALALKRRVAAARPRERGVQWELAMTSAFVSNALERGGQLAEALAERRAYLAIQERLAAAAPDNQEQKLDLAVARGFVAGLLLALGEGEEARALYRTGLDEVTAISRLDPTNAERKRWQATFLSALGRVALEAGDASEALGRLRSAEAILAPLVDSDPTNSDWQLQLGLCHGRLAAALAGRDPGAAGRHAAAGLAILRRLVAKGGDDAARAAAAEVELTASHLAAAAGHPAERTAACERALALAVARAGSDWRLLDPEAQALGCLGRADEARAVRERLAAMGYRGRRLAEPVAAASSPRS